MLDRYGVDGEGLYEKIRDEIRESPLFRFDWFFLSRTPIEIGRRCTTLLNTVSREFDGPEVTNGHGPGKGRGRDRDDEDVENEDEMPPAKKKAKNGVVVSSHRPLRRSAQLTMSSQNKQITAVKSGAGSKGTSTATSRAVSVSSTNGSASKGKGKKK
jgi:SWI/SNF-related matrix-associated actin-dependent regulator of chromatin subfamily A member 5